MGRTNKLISVVTSCALLLALFSGCTSEVATNPADSEITENSTLNTLESKPTDLDTTVPSASDVEETVTSTIDSTLTPTDETTVEIEETTIPTEPPETVPPATLAPDGMTDEQRNSMNMLNYLAVVTQEIHEAKNNRLFLENAYSQLLSNTHPNAIDHGTLAHIEDILDTLEGFRMIQEKRERLEFISENQKAQAIHAAVPNPLGLVSATQSKNPLKIAASIIYMTVDSAASYSESMNQAQMQYLEQGWTLNDEEAEELHDSRKGTFSYMVQTVTEYNLPGDLALSEDAVDEFVRMKNNDNVARRISFLEFNEETYKGLGMYWLTLAESYFENGQNEKGLETLSTYEELNSQIFRKDYEYVRILPLAICAAEEVYTGDDYVEAVEYYIKQIEANTDSDDWAAHYFAAQAYTTLYGKTHDISHLESAYKLVKNNITQLADVQDGLNVQYISEINTLDIPEDATKAQKKEIKEYNKMLKEARKTELPPVCEPLVLNCDLLFALAEKLNISDSEQKTVDQILHGGDTPLFLDVTLNNKYCFAPQVLNYEDFTVEFSGDELKLPAALLSAATQIKVSVKEMDTQQVTVFDDFLVSDVEREDGAFDTFYVTGESELANDYDYSENAEISIIIMPSGREEDSVTIEFRSIPKKIAWVFNGIDFERVKR